MEKDRWLQELIALRSGSAEVKSSTRSLAEQRVTKDIDVFRLTELIDPTVRIAMPAGVYRDIQEFVQRMESESVDLKQLGLPGRTKDQILEELKEMYIV